jgi:electron transport complex protein RnfD
MLNDKLTLSVSPHLRGPEDVPKIMADVVIALVPTTIAGVILFGFPALWVVLTAVISAVVAEAICQIMMGKPVTIWDFSAVVTGLLLALNLPSGIPLWMVVLGSAFAIGLGKQVFGGLGGNPFNPALVARVFLLISFPLQMTTWPITKFMRVDAITSATPLAGIKEAMNLKFSYLDLFLGNRGGCIGEVSVVCLLVGAIYLLWRKVITWHIPFSCISTVAIISLLFWLKDPKYGDPLFHILAGGLVLGAFFMATDYTTSPITPKAQILFGIGCGIITIIIRLFGGYPEGVSFSILLMNAVVPLLNRWRRLSPRRFGC